MTERIKSADELHSACRERTASALQIARSYGQTDGDHHKTWVIDQMIRALLDQDYDAWVERYCHGEDGAATYRWETGVAP